MCVFFQVSGHKNIHSLNSYSKLSDRECKLLGHVLSKTTTSMTSTTTINQMETKTKESSYKGSTFHITNCTLHM